MLSNFSSPPYKFKVGLKERTATFVRGRWYNLRALRLAIAGSLVSFLKFFHICGRSSVLSFYSRSVCEGRCSISSVQSMLPFFILSLLLFLIVTVVIVPGVMQQSQEVVDEVVGMWQTPSLFTGLAALVLLLVCIPGGPLAPVMNTVRNL